MALTNRIQTQQHLRLQGQAMIIGAYLLWLLTIFVIQAVGFDTISSALWIVLLTLTMIGNLLFWGIIYSGVNLRWADPSLTWLQTAYAGVVMILTLYALPAMRSVILLLFIPVFSLGMLRLTRRAYMGLVIWVMGLYGALLLVEYLEQRPSFQMPDELFLFILFGIVLVWFAIISGLIASGRRRLKNHSKTIQMASKEIKMEVRDRRRLEMEKTQLILELQEALSKVKVLNGLLPLCASCKKIREDAGYWNRLDDYFGKHANASFTHSICTECTKAAVLDINRYFPTG